MSSTGEESAMTPPPLNGRFRVRRSDYHPGVSQCPVWAPPNPERAPEEESEVTQDPFLPVGHGQQDIKVPFSHEDCGLGLEGRRWCLRGDEGPAGTMKLGERVEGFGCGWSLLVDEAWLLARGRCSRASLEGSVLQQAAGER